MMLPLLLALAQAAPVASAAPGPGQPPATMVVEPVAMTIAGFDADGDGRVTRAECDAGVARSFAQVSGASAGSIGYIGYGEWAKRWLGDANALPSPFSVDANGDNRITLAELTAAIDAVFARLDRDHDGVLTHAELLTIRVTGTGGADDGRRRHK